MTALITGFTPNQWHALTVLMAVAAVTYAALLIAHERKRARDRRIQKVRTHLGADLEIHFADALTLARNDDPLNLCRTPDDFAFAGAVLADIDDLGGVA